MALSSGSTLACKAVIHPKALTLPDETAKLCTHREDRARQPNCERRPDGDGGTDVCPAHLTNHKGITHQPIYSHGYLLQAKRLKYSFITIFHWSRVIYIRH